MNIFKENLKELIEEENISLRKFAKKCGVSAMSLSNYLNGTEPNIKNAIKLAYYFGCSLDYLFGIDENKVSNYKSTAFDLSQFISKYENLLTQNNITHYKFAKEMNLSESCIRHWKNGQTPKIESLYIIAKNLCSSIDYLIGRK